MKSWLCILNRENFEVVKEVHVWGVAQRHYKRIVTTEIGDKCAFYLIKESFCGQELESAIGGVFVIASKPYEDCFKIFSPKDGPDQETYPYRVKLKPVMLFVPNLPFKPLIPLLKFIVNKKNYSSHMRGKAMRTIPDEDMKVILDSAEVHESKW